MKKISHIYWFAPYSLDCPSTRYRGKIPLELAQENQALSYDFILPERSLQGAWQLLKMVISLLFFRKKNSLLVIQKVCSNRIYANILKLLVWWNPKNTLYDLDDAEYIRQAPDSLHFFLQHCQAVQVGSQALKEYCQQFNSTVYIATSPVYQHAYHKTQKNDKLHIGWVGDVGNGQHLSRNFAHKRSLFEILFPSLVALSFPIKLSIVGVKNQEDLPQIRAFFEQCSHVELDIPLNLNWKKDNWLYEKICQFDVGVSPLVHHPFNEAKSAFKAKQYLSCGVPVIASDVGENKTFIHHQSNGFLASSKEDFAQFLQQIKDMQAVQYTSYIENALQTYDSFSMKHYSQLLLEVENKAFV